MEIAKILNIIVVLLLPVVVLYRDWKYHDKQQEEYNKITFFLIFFWLISAFTTAFFTYNDNQQISILAEKSDRLLDHNQQLSGSISLLKKANEDSAKLHDYKLDELAQKVVLSVNEGCLNDIKNMTQLIIDKHKETFQSTEDESNKWAKSFIEKIEQYNNKRTENINKLTEQSDKSLPYFLALLEYTVNIFDNIISGLSKTGIVVMGNQYINYRLADLDLKQDQSYLIRQANFQNGESISMIVRGRIVKENYNPIDHNSINIRHPRIDFILNQDEKDFNNRPSRKNLLLRIESGLINNCWGFDDRCTNGYISTLGYKIDQDPLESDDITNNINRDLKKIFEIVYLNSKKQ